MSRRTLSPVTVSDSARVVGMPSAAIASLPMNSRTEERSTARPSAVREYGVSPAPCDRNAGRVSSVSRLSILAVPLAMSPCTLQQQHRAAGRRLRQRLASSCSSRRASRGARGNVKKPFFQEF